MSLGFSVFFFFKEFIVENLELAYLLPSPLPPSVFAHFRGGFVHLECLCPQPTSHWIPQDTYKEKNLSYNLAFCNEFRKTCSHRTSKNYNCASELCMVSFSTSHLFPDNKSGYPVTLRPSPGSTKRSQTMLSFLNWGLGAGDWLESCCAWVKACFQGGPDLSAVASASACSVLGGRTASAVFLDLSLSLAVQPLFIYWVFCFVFLFLNWENKNIIKFPFNHIKVYQLSGLNIYFVMQPRPPELFSSPI